VPQVVNVSYESVKKANNFDLGRGRGVIELHYVDDQDLGGGEYWLFIKLEIKE
jgi:hypothetical protein